jgi:hypothetical protein
MFKIMKERNHVCISFLCSDFSYLPSMKYYTAGFFAVTSKKKKKEKRRRRRRSKTFLKRHFQNSITFIIGCWRGLRSQSAKEGI